MEDIAKNITLKITLDLVFNKRKRKALNEKQKIY